MLSRSSSWTLRRRRRRSCLPVATSAAHVACATRNGLQWAGLGYSGCRSRQRNLDLFSRVSSLPSPVWGLFLFLFRQHRRQHCYCLLMHYFALFSCGRQRQQQVAAAAAAQADGVARAWQWASVQHTNLFFFAVCGELKIHKFSTSQMCCTHARGGAGGRGQVKLEVVTPCVLRPSAWIMSRVGVVRVMQIAGKVEFN